MPVADCIEAASKMSLESECDGCTLDALAHANLFTGAWVSCTH